MRDRTTERGTRRAQDRRPADDPDPIPPAGTPRPQERPERPRWRDHCHRPRRQQGRSRAAGFAPLPPRLQFVERRSTTSPGNTGVRGVRRDRTPVHAEVASDHERPTGAGPGSCAPRELGWTSGPVQSQRRICVMHPGLRLRTAVEVVLIHRNERRVAGARIAARSLEGSRLGRPMARRTKGTREAVVSGAHYRESLQLRADLWPVPLCACVATLLLLLITVRVDLAAARGGLTLPGLSVGGADDAPRRTRWDPCRGFRSSPLASGGVSR